MYITFCAPIFDFNNFELQRLKLRGFPIDVLAVIIPLVLKIVPTRLGKHLDLI